MLRRATLALTILAAPLVYGQATNRIFFTVTDPANRFVTGLTQQHFEVKENGINRPVRAFVGVDEAMAIAVVSPQGRKVDFASVQTPAQIIEATSVAAAIRQLKSASAPRKALIITAPTGESTAIPGGIFVRVGTAGTAGKTIVEVANQYAIEYESLDPAATVRVTVQPPRGLPPLAAKLAIN